MCLLLLIYSVSSQWSCSAFSRARTVPPIDLFTHNNVQNLYYRILFHFWRFVFENFMKTLVQKSMSSVCKPASPRKSKKSLLSVVRRLVRPYQEPQHARTAPWWGHHPCGLCRSVIIIRGWVDLLVVLAGVSLTDQKLHPSVLILPL